LLAQNDVLLPHNNVLLAQLDCQLAREGVGDAAAPWRAAAPLACGLLKPVWLR
jgi:hypothetical protein